MKIPFWQPAEEYNKHKAEVDGAMQRVLSKGELVLGYGDDIEKFEESFAKYIGTKYAVMTGSGTQSLFLAYKALGIGAGDEVITTSHTFIATIDQIAAVGATPVLVDIDRATGLMDPKLLKEKINHKTKAIVPVHLEGNVCNMREILNIGKHLLVIEDAAQAVGASEGGVGKNTGAIGDVGCFSFYPAKILGSYGNAGAITTNNKEVAEKIKLLRCNSNIGKNPDLNAEYGHNMEPDNIQAAVLNVKMKYLDKKIARRKEVAMIYDIAFCDADLPILLPKRTNGRVYQDYIIRSRERDNLNKFLNDNGIGTRGTNLIPNHNYTKLDLNFKLPNTEDYIAEQIRIPCNPDITNKEVEYVISKIKEFYA